MSVLRPFLSACVMLPLWSGTVLAEQSSAEPVKQATAKAEGPCAVIFSEASSLLNDAEITYRADGCTLTNVTFNAGMYQNWTAQKVEISSAALDEKAQTLPEWGEVHIQSVGFWPSNLPAMRYLSKLKDDGFSLKVAYRWDQDSKVLNVNEVRLYGKYIGEVLASAIVELPELPKLDALDEPTPPVDNIKLREISAKLDDQGFFVNYVMMTLVGLIGYDHDPEPEVENYRAMALAFVAGLSPEMLASDDKQAIIRFITDLPKPKTPAEIHLNFDPAIALAQNDKEPLKMLGELQKTLKIKASYAGQ
ncbi:hypothetical protein [Pseudochrobactrum kiredjianiae]|uniref:Uncharacterized protein n=1 Tax=Pseudochrobactrum kiredjianiae TaxID=386305 RepID=A0ABW3V8V9_9HYPH|nr:hypothetical protein [Pseudochrobactrum kiredjianiae]MDM7849982.1 hypothetical protein [Pseudochrobactrum kiredjianiae]